MNYYIYLDDSGNLTNKSKDKFFVYGGMLIKEPDMQMLLNNYSALAIAIKNESPVQYPEEVKGALLTNKHRRSLLSALKTNNEQIFVVVKKDECTSGCLDNNQDTVRFGNFCISYLVQGLFMQGLLPNCKSISIYIDEQNIAVSAKDSLEDYLHNSINLENYYKTKKSSITIKNMVKFLVMYRDSKVDYLIQAADILANTKWRKFERKIDFSNHFQKIVHCVKIPNSSFKSSD